jgi:1,4-alpha-glucan branching enzyme
MGRHSKLGVTLTHKGAEFAVWAPFAETVGVTGDFTNWSEEGTPLEKDEDGVWSGYIEGVNVGQQYKYVIRHGKKLLSRNDPRALQLTAAQDATVIVDPDFDWQGDAFELAPPNEQVVYEMHIGTFNRPDPATPGTFATAMEKLDYLQSLGVNVIEVLPVSGTNMERWWGYEPTYLFSVEAAYGGRHAFMEFVREAHKRGIGVVVDVVYNHLSPQENFDMWRFDGWSVPGKGGIYFYSDHRIETPWGPRPDYGRPEVRQYIIDSAMAWVEGCHVDGLRADAVFAIRNAKGYNDDPDNDIPEGWQMLQDLNRAIHAANPHAITIAEDVACNNYITLPDKKGGAVFNAQWQTTFPNTLRHAIDPVNDSDRVLGPVEEEIRKAYNGDAFQRVVYSESHDAAANGQARMNEEIAPKDPGGIFARRRSMLGAAAALTAPGIPMLFQGQEFMERGWFTHWDALEWNRTDTYAGTVQFYRDLITLRRNLRGQTAGLKGQGFETLNVDETNKLLAYHRFDAGGPNDDTVVVLNFANAARTNYQIKFPHAGTWKVRLNSDWQGYSADFTNHHTDDVVVENEQGTISIAPYSVLILSQDPS